MATIDNDFAAMLDECLGVFGQSVTITRVTRGPFNASTGTHAETTQAVATTAVRSVRDVEDAAMGGYGVKVRERTYRVRASALGWDPGEGTTRVTDDEGTHEVCEVDRSVNGLCWDLRCRETLGG